jgi:phosphoribosylamine--glycine ligase
MSEGYPGDYEKGYVITGIEEARATGALVFCAGVQLNGKRQLVNSGGRVINIVGIGEYEGDFAGAQRNAYRAAEIIKFANKYYRDDIGNKALKHKA